MERIGSACRNAPAPVARLFRRRYANAATTRQLLPFKIPEPIERSPTTLLEALSSTVGVDVTAPHFVFIDDPAMIPSTKSRKIQYYLCREFGKRAARQLAEEWPTLFMFDRDQPRLPVFRPEKPLDPLVVEPTEANLRRMITGREVEDAVRLYERMAADSVDMSPAVTLELFQLVCYYNGRNVPVTENREWHGIRNFTDLPATSEAVDHTIAELLFVGLEKTADAYSMMICCLLKHGDEKSVGRAVEFVKEMLATKLTPAEEVFNLLINGRVRLFEREKYFDVTTVLRGMAGLGVCPSVRTFNAAIQSTFSTEDLGQRLRSVRSLLAEMRACKIEPNLTTYAETIVASFKAAQRGFNRRASPEELGTALATVVSALNALDSRPSITPSEPTDERFFSLAMEVAEHVNHASAVDRLVALYEAERNHVRFSSFEPEARFYHTFLLSKLNRTPLEKFEELYVSQIPRLTSLSMHLFYRIVDRLKHQPRWSLLWRLIDDGIVAGHAAYSDVSSVWKELLIEFPIEKLSEPEMEQYRALCTRLIDTWRALNEEREAISELIQKREAEKAAAAEGAEAEEADEDTSQLPQPPQPAGRGKKESRRKNVVSGLIDFVHFETVMVQRGIVAPTND